MNSAPVADSGTSTQEITDLVWEMRLRTWARRNYVETYDRDPEWHPVVLDEMVRIDQGE